MYQVRDYRSKSATDDGSPQQVDTGEPRFGNFCNFSPQQLDRGQDCANFNELSSQAFPREVSPGVYLVLVGAYMLPGALHDQHDDHHDLVDDHRHYYWGDHDQYFNVENLLSKSAINAICDHDHDGVDKGARAKHQESDNHRTSLHVQVMTTPTINIAILTRTSIEEHRESRDPNHPRDYIDCYLDQVFGRRTLKTVVLLQI